MISSSTNENIILQLENVKKYFSGVKAVDDVSFSILQGEVHALVGENGAGKSTLMNILAGVYRADNGRVLFHGEVFNPENPRVARAKGISTVFQELNLFPELNVEANLYAGDEISEHGFLTHKEMREQSIKSLNEMKVNLDPSSLVDDLSIGQRQWVEIGRAVTGKSEVLILDEPNSALNQKETNDLFDLIRRLKKQGITIIYISHRLEEVFEIADRITIMRDGHYIETRNIADTTISEIVAAMVGKKVRELDIHEHKPSDKVILETRSLSLDGKLENVSLTIHEGEVVGVVGLSGSGTSDLFETIFGIQKPTSAKIIFEDKELFIGSPKIAMSHRIAMVPSDRRGLGLMLNWSVLDNITLAVINRFSNWGFLKHKEMKNTAHDYVRQLQIATSNISKHVQFLSGGNQQKVLLSRWLATNPNLLILDDPTRGIDVLAKQEIYELVDNIAKKNVAIMITSSEIDEVLSLSDRILVMRKGKLIADLPYQVCDKGLVMEFVAGDPQEGKKRIFEKMAEMPSSNFSDPIIYDQEYIQDATPTFNTEKALPETNKKVNPENSKESKRLSGVRTFVKKVMNLRETGVLQALFFVLLLFTILSPYFFTVNNISLILRQMSIICLISLGMTFALASGEVDLSVGWIFNSVMGCMAFISVNFGLDPWLTIPIGLLFGLVLGMINGLLAVGLNLPTMIITLGTMTVYRGISLAINQGKTISGLPESSFFTIGRGGIGPISYMSIIMIIFVIVIALIWKNSIFVRHLLIKGGNSIASERVGIRNKRLRVLVMSFSGLMCAFGAVLGLSFLGAADAQIGKGYEMLAVASAVIGGAQLNGGSGTIWGSLIGVALIMAIQNGLVIIGMSPAWQTTFTGIVILSAVALDYLTRSRRKRSLVKNTDM